MAGARRPAATFAAAGISAVLLTGATTGTAQASSEDVATLSNRTVEVSGGTLTHIDDGDVFRICDTWKDGRAVYGAVFYNSYVYPDGYKRTKTLNDGGDAGCDKKAYDISNSGTYTIVICEGKYPTSAYQSGASCTHSGEFNE